MEALMERTYTQEKTLADRVNEILKEIKMNKQELALRIDYSRPAVSRYLNGKYETDSTELEERLWKFVHEYEAGSHADEGEAKPELKVVSGVRKKIEYFESTDYIQTIGICKACQENMALGIIVAKSGYGKTHTLKRYAKMPRVVYIEGNETMNCKDIVRRIESRIGMSRSYGSIDERMERIIEFFNVNEGYLLIMDEADKLINKYTQKKIELLRNITDSADVGLVIAGEPILENLLKGYDKRFTNRMDFYYKLRGLSQQEVRDYLEGYDIDEAAMAEFLVRATNSQTGCFRLLDRTLNNVIRLLNDSGQTKVTMKIMKQASNMMML
ncbi:MAG: AAA family ATPase [Roseburia sp.]|nr:AAA family ATPase [Roseburia sp.]